MLDEEKNTQESVDKAQIYEFVLLSQLLNQIVKVLKKNNNKLERTKALVFLKNLRKKETNKFIKELDESSLNALKNIKNSVIEEMPKKIKKPKLKKLDNSNYISDFRKYIKSKGVLINGQSLESYLMNNCDKYYNQIANGELTLDNAIRKMVKDMTKDGLQFVYYDHTKRNIDVFVRQSLLFTQKESAQDIRKKYAKENNVTIFEIDAHADSRPSHQFWQGKRFDTTGKDYPTFEQLSNGHGSLEDYGCLHRAYPIFDKNSKQAWTQEELKNINTKPFYFKGVKYTGYEAKQRMRAYERSIRKIKREKNLLESQNLKSDVINMKLKKASKNYNEFCKVYGTYPRNNRTRVVTKKD